MSTNALRNLLGIGAVAVGLLACGTPTETAEAPVMSTPTSLSPEPQPAPTTTVRGPVPGELPPINPVISLAPEGAYPVLHVTDATDDLAPGTYRLRDDFSADWPEQCLPERIILPPPDGSYDITTDTAAGPENLGQREEEAIAAMAKIRELQTPI